MINKDLVLVSILFLYIVTYTLRTEGMCDEPFCHLMYGLWSDLLHAFLDRCVP